MRERGTTRDWPKNGKEIYTYAKTHSNKNSMPTENKIQRNIHHPGHCGGGGNFSNGKTGGCIRHKQVPGFDCESTQYLGGGLTTGQDIDLDAKKNEKETWFLTCRYDASWKTFNHFV